MLVRSTYVVARYSRYHNRECASVQRERQKRDGDSVGGIRDGVVLMLALDRLLAVLTSPQRARLKGGCPVGCRTHRMRSDDTEGKDSSSEP